MAATALDAKTFSEYLRRRWDDGFGVGETGEAPYRELVSLRGGWSLSLGVASDDDPSNLRARVGVWLRPAGSSGSAELAPLRTHYQQAGVGQRREREPRGGYDDRQHRKAQASRHGDCLDELERGDFQVGVRHIASTRSIVWRPPQPRLTHAQRMPQGRRT